MASYMNCFTFLQTISLVYFLITLTCTSGSYLSHDEECSALFQFKQSMIHQDDVDCAASWFQAFHSWKPRKNASDSGFGCCSWYGVECSNDHRYGHVVGLDLSERSLCGHINSTSTLFSLVRLQSLNLAMNNFDESQIPSEIAHLKKLRSLNLSYSGFTGHIPAEISQLHQLSFLDLSRNSLQLQSPRGFNNLVKNLTRLEELHLSGVDISSSVPHFLANFSSLRLLTLQECSLLNALPAAILELPKLKILNLAYNDNLTGSFPKFRNISLLEVVILDFTGFFGILPESISKHLIILSVSGCSFSGRIPGSISNMTQLVYLGLGDNNFTGFVPSLVSLSKLSYLELDGTKFEKGCLPSWLGKLTELNKVYLSNMSINGEIPPFFANLTKLSDVEMAKNSLTGNIPPSFFNLTQLTQLDLYENKLQGQISKSFSKFKRIKYLSLASNNFSGNVGLHMFLGLNKLVTLELAYNRISLVPTNNYTNFTLPELEDLALSSCNLKEFPAFLRFQNSLNVLLLYYNKIEGMVPVWIWNNSRETLQLIDLSNNFITGFHHYPHVLPWRQTEEFLIGNNQLRGQLPIPPKTTVSYLVSNNNLTGEIPPLICELEFLRLLDISSNNMSGHLPPCLGKLSNSLVGLNLRQNNFHGIMMNAFMHGSLLKGIDLSENGFTGQLPRSLTNCTNLEVLSLGDNSFDDVFPFWLTLPKLRVLIFRSNKFYGPIQGSTTVCSQFPNLRIVDLSNNNFTGQLHQKYFQDCTAMNSIHVGILSVMKLKVSSEMASIEFLYSMKLIHKGVKTSFERILTVDMAIDLSCNNFEGQIPISVKDLQGLQSLNLSYNHFTGHVFPSLGYLKNLESLDLSQNKLSGEIPHQLVELGFLSIFNVSFNNLEGAIPQGKQFDTFENNSYMGNPHLCGKPISMECHKLKVSGLLPTRNKSESLLPSERIDWIIIFCGVGSGLVVGIVIGNFLYTRYKEQQFRKRYNRGIKPLRNKRRNKGSAKDSIRGRCKASSG